MMRLPRTAMRAPVAVLLLLAVTAPVSGLGPLRAQTKVVIGYYPSWKWGSRNNLVNPERLPYDKLTLINYSFFVPLPDGRLVGKDRVGDSLYLDAPAGMSIVDRAHRRGVRVVLSLGGWEDSDNFPAIASSARLRAEFSHSCLEAIRKYRFDGIDVDWEYPGFAEHKGTPEDRVNFTLLLSSLRDSLTAHGRREGREYLLTAALPAGAVHARNLEAPKITELLDYLNLMTYDFHGAWDPVVNHNSPLFPSDGADPERCLDAAFRLYRDTLGIPASKITLGVPFYGRAYAGTVALNSTHAGADTTVFPGAGPFYYDLAPAIGRFTRIWDEKARVPYLVDTAARVVVSYDDEMSVREKARYVAEHGAGGVIIWEITGDFMPDGTTPLLDALLSGLH